MRIFSQVRIVNAAILTWTQDKNTRNMENQTVAITAKLKLTLTLYLDRELGPQRLRTLLLGLGFVLSDFQSTKTFSFNSHPIIYIVKLRLLIYSDWWQYSRFSYRFGFLSQGRRSIKDRGDASPKVCVGGTSIAMSPQSWGKIPATCDMPHYSQH